MPFDGVVTKCISRELSDLLMGGRIEKIYQPESDEIVLMIRSNGNNYRLLMSASAKYPRVHITTRQKENPQAAPTFCMLLRKYISGGRIVNIEFYDYERIITIDIESINDIEEYTVKKLTIEIMGRYSNIILVSDQGKILDSIKHVDFGTSSVREVMPGKQYMLPPAQDKFSPEILDSRAMLNIVPEEGKTIDGFLLDNIKGFSPLLCREICGRATLDSKTLMTSLSDNDFDKLAQEIEKVLTEIKENAYKPCIIYSPDDTEKPLDFHCIPIYTSSAVKYMNSVNETVDEFYYYRDHIERLRQKKSDITKVLSNNIDRASKKLNIQQKSLKDVEGRDKLQLFGELITANIYAISKGLKEVSLLNYYSETEEYIKIPLDEQLSPQENAQRYFRQYTKAKNTFLHVSRQLEDTKTELEYLQNVSHLLDNCATIQEIDEIRQELAEQGYISIKRKNGYKKPNRLSSPFHFISTDGFDIYVGKNNKQNDQLTLKASSSNDTWLHTKDIPGSHVIIKGEYQKAVPNQTLLEAAILAAYHSKAKQSSGVQVDYTLVKNVKKLPGAKPGMVTYDKFKTIVVTPDETIVKSLDKN